MQLMSTITLRAPTSTIAGTIPLSGSKSISNRVLMVAALSGKEVDISGLSDSDDTKTLQHMLSVPASSYDAGHAGTTFRFMTAYLSLQSGTQTLTGSDRMLERPIGPLVDALVQLGADITYLGREGYPPLRIGPYAPQRYEHTVSISSSISSQYISALLMIAPTLPRGLRLQMTGATVSRSYIEMTLRIMQHFGAVYRWVDESTIDIPSQSYTSLPYSVEADWSAASYYYSIAAIATQADIVLLGLTDQAIQGDAAIVEIGKTLGVTTSYIGEGVRITKTQAQAAKRHIEYDFILEPDIAQTISVACAALGISGLYSGLQTLRIKETDRIFALQHELAKVGVVLSALPARFSARSGVEYFMQEGKATWKQQPTFETYHDHRMAMAFAPLALLGEITITDPQVVTKSYANFWSHLEQLSFEIITT